jgi:transposase
MSLGRQAGRQSDLLLSWDELPRSSGHPFYDRLQEVLLTAGFDRFVENLRALLFLFAPRTAIAAAGAVFPHVAGRLF